MDDWCGWPNAKNLSELRRMIEGIDDSMLHLIWLRVQVARDVARAKRLTNGMIEDLEREKIVLERVKRTASEKDLEPWFVEQFWKLIMAYAKDVQYQETF